MRFAVAHFENDSSEMPLCYAHFYCLFRMLPLIYGGFQRFCHCFSFVFSSSFTKGALLGKMESNKRIHLICVYTKDLMIFPSLHFIHCRISIWWIISISYLLSNQFFYQYVLETRPNLNTCKIWGLGDLELCCSWWFIIIFGWLWTFNVQCGSVILNIRYGIQKSMRRIIELIWQMYVSRTAGAHTGYIVKIKRCF